MSYKLTTVLRFAMGCSTARCKLASSPKYKSHASFYYLNYLIIFTVALFSISNQTQATKYSNHHLDTKIGQAIFEKLWVFAPSSTKSSDGLGPFYNARSCQQCHDVSKPYNTLPPSLVIHLSIEPPSPLPSTHPSLLALNELGFIPEPMYGKQLQTFAYPGAKSEASISVKQRSKEIKFDNGETLILKKPIYEINNLAYGELHQDTKLSARVAPRMDGLGLLEKIPNTAIEALADPFDIDKNNISGKINKVWNPEKHGTDIGKFGWKAAKATLQHQNLVALSTDIGISNWLFPNPEGDCTNLQHDCINLARSSETDLLKTSTEASKYMTDLLLTFTNSLGMSMLSEPLTITSPPTNKPTQKGNELFLKLGCSSCHHPSFIINQTNEDGIITEHQIRPYTDLLLHDMGDALADNRKEFQANGKEWRTAPLWGIANYLKKAKTPHFLHDGRARSVTEAILWHGGEAEQSKRAFMELNKHQRTNLIEFVESL